MRDRAKDSVKPTVKDVQLPKTKGLSFRDALSVIAKDADKKVKAKKESKR